MKFSAVLSNNFLDILKTQIDGIGLGLKEGKRQLVIVPMQYNLFLTKLILDRLSLQATIGIDIMSIDKLASQLMPDFKPISMLDEALIIEDLVFKHSDELVCFVDTLKSVAFASQLARTINTLEACNVSPDDLDKAYKKVNNVSLKSKLTDITLIYRYYLDELKAKSSVDMQGFKQKLASAIEQGEYSNCDVHFCMFDNFDLIEYSIIQSFILQANSVSIGVLSAGDGQPNAELYSNSILENLKNIASNLDTTLDIKQSENDCGEVSKHILNNLLAVQNSVYRLENSDTIRIYEAGNPRLEIEWVALDILQKIKAGARYRDFAIGVTDIETYAPMIKKIFEDFGLSFWIDTKFAFENTEAGKLVQALLDLVASDMEVSAVYRVLNNALVSISNENRELYKNVTTHYGLTKETLRTVQKPNCEDKDFDCYLKLNEGLLKPIFDFVDKMHTAHTLNEYVNNLKDMFDILQVEEQLENLASTATMQGDLERANIARQSYTKLIEALDSIVNVMGNMSVSIAEFKKIWQNCISSVSIAPLPRSVDCVCVGDYEKSVFGSVEYLYLVGAIEGNLPRSVGDVELISDNDKVELSEVSVRIIPLVREINALSRLNMIERLGHFEKGLIITYPRNSADGEAVPANMVGALQKIFIYNDAKLPIINLNYYLTDDNAFGGRHNRLATLYVNKDTMLRGYIERIGNGQKDGITKALATCIEENEPNILAKLEQWRTIRTTVPRLTRANELFFAQGKAGVTQIEKFFDCPYAHFLNYGIKLKEKKSSHIEALDTGNILHGVLEKFGILLKNKGIQDEASIEKIVREIFDNVIKSPQFAHLVLGGKNQARLEALYTEAVRACGAVNYQLSHSKYKVCYVEAKFGTDGFVPVPTIAIINTGKTIKINGKIDRADICGNRLRIVDYKTSKNSADFKLLNFYMGKKIQLFYYLAVILEYLKMQPGGAFYLPVHNEYFEGDVESKYSSYCMSGVPLDDAVDILCQDDQLSLEHPKSDIVRIGLSTSKENVANDKIVMSNKVKADEKTFGYLLKYAKDVLEGAINDIANGVIAPAHLSKSCEYCKYREICGSGVTTKDCERSEDWSVESAKVFEFEEE